MQKEDERVDWAMIGGPLKMVEVVATTREGSTNIRSEVRMREVDTGGGAMKNMGMGITTIRRQNRTLMWN